MCLLKLKSQSFALVVFPVLCLLAGNVGADEQLVWPVESDLVYNDGDIASLWHDSGDVAIWNTKDDLKIAVNPDGDLQIAEVSIHIVQDPDFCLQHPDTFVCGFDFFFESLDGIIRAVRLFKKPDIVLPDPDVTAELLQFIGKLIPLKI